jgi:predicted AAA+ superfamily ATPase/DNA-binding CsgD family transcriptional regulator
VKYVPRKLKPVLLEAARHFPAVLLTGPRRAGKTFLLKTLLKGAEYHLLETPDVIARVSADPHGFLDSLRTPVILDEVQNIPGLFASVRAIIDRQPRKMGQWFLTGSQESPMISGAAESMAGRAAILKLLPFALTESRHVSLLRGGFPEVQLLPQRAASIWFSSYIQTYLERDVRSISGIKDLAVFRRFLALVTARHSQLLNRSDLAAGLGVSVPTISHWLSILEATMQVIIVPPWYENMSKRLVKTPKLYLTDSGMASHLLGIESADELRRSTHRGPLFEGLVVSEILKARVNAGRRPEVYFYRDEDKVEVDFVLPAGNGRIVLFEAKSSETPDPRDAASMLKVRLDFLRRNPSAKVECFVVYPRIGGVSGRAVRSLSDGVMAITIEEVATAALKGMTLKVAASGKRSGDKPSQPPLLDDRQLRILKMIAAGKTNRQMAEELPLNRHTVDANIRRIFTTLGCNNRSGAIAAAFAKGLL